MTRTEFEIRVYQTYPKYSQTEVNTLADIYYRLRHGDDWEANWKQFQKTENELKT